MILVGEKEETVEIYEFQGEFEGMEEFNGCFDEKTKRMEFEHFYLQGKYIEKDLTICEVFGTEINIISHIEKVCLFDKPSRFKLNKK